MENVKEINCSVKGKDWDKYIDAAFDKKKKSIKVDGFRKGACPRDVYYKKVGKESLYMDAADKAVDDKYKKEISKIDDIACEPSFEIVSMGKDGIEFNFTVITKPEVKLGKYTKLGVKKDKVEVTDEEIEHEIEHIKSHMVEIVNKENGNVIDGNIAVIDFEGIVDGEILDGGTGKNYELEIGSNTFIPGFEEGLIGAEIGEERELKLKFPEDYKEDLKGKDVLFKVTVNAIKEKIEPEINKDFFDDLGIDGVDSMDKLKAHVKDDIAHGKEHQVEEKYTDMVLKTACDNMTVEINKEIIDDEVNRMIDEYRRDMDSHGIKFEDYLGYVGMTMESLRETLTPQAEARVKVRYLLDAIVEKEKIEATKEEIEAETNKIKEIYGIEDNIPAEMVEMSVKMNKAIELVKEA